MKILSYLFLYSLISSYIFAMEINNHEKIKLSKETETALANFCNINKIIRKIKENFIADLYTKLAKEIKEPQKRTLFESLFFELETSEEIVKLLDYFFDLTGFKNRDLLEKALTVHAGLEKLWKLFQPYPYKRTFLNEEIILETKKKLNFYAEKYKEEDDFLDIMLFQYTTFEKLIEESMNIFFEWKDQQENTLEIEITSRKIIEYFTNSKNKITSKELNIENINKEFIIKLSENYLNAKGKSWLSIKISIGILEMILNKEKIEKNLENYKQKLNLSDLEKKERNRNEKEIKEYNEKIYLEELKIDYDCFLKEKNKIKEIIEIKKQQGQPQILSIEKNNSLSSNVEWMNKINESIEYFTFKDDYTLKFNIMKKLETFKKNLEEKVKNLQLVPNYLNEFINFINQKLILSEDINKKDISLIIINIEKFLILKNTSRNEIVDKFLQRMKLYFQAEFEKIEKEETDNKIKKTNEKKRNYFLFPFNFIKEKLFFWVKKHKKKIIGSTFGGILIWQLSKKKDACEIIRKKICLPIKEFIFKRFDQKSLPLTSTLQKLKK